MTTKYHQVLYDFDCKIDDCDSDHSRLGYEGPDIDAAVQNAKEWAEFDHVRSVVIVTTTQERVEIK